MSDPKTDSEAVTALRALMERHTDNLYLFVYGIVRNREVAEEIVSEVFCRVWNRRQRMKEVRNAPAFLFVVARNLSVSYLRRAQRMRFARIDRLEEFSLELADAADEAPEEREKALADALSRLPAKCKMAFLLAKVDGLKYREIARIMHVAESTVKNHVAYAIRRLQELLG